MTVAPVSARRRFEKSVPLLALRDLKSTEHGILTGAVKDVQAVAAFFIYTLA